MVMPSYIEVLYGYGEKTSLEILANKLSSAWGAG